MITCRSKPLRALSALSLLACAENSGVSAPSPSSNTSQLLDEALVYYQSRAKEVEETTARDDMLIFLQNHPAVKEATLSQDGFSYWVFPNEGRPGVVIPYDHIPDFASDPLENDLPRAGTRRGVSSTACEQPTPEDRSPEEVDPIRQRRAVIIDLTSDNPYEKANHTWSSWHTARDGDIRRLELLDVQVSHRQRPTLGLGDLVNLGDAGIVIWMGHGGIHTDGTLALFTDIPWTEAQAEATSAGYGADEVIETRLLGDSLTLVTLKFFDQHLPPMNQPLAFFGSCYSLMSGGGLKEVFFARGGHTYIGNTQLGNANLEIDALNGLLAGMTYQGHDAKRALYGDVSAANRVGVADETLRGNPPPPCLELRSRAEAQPLAFLSNVSFQLQNLPEDTIGSVRVSSRVGGRYVAPFELEATATQVKPLYSSFESGRFTAIVTSASMGALPATTENVFLNSPEEAVTLAFRQECPQPSDYSYSWQSVCGSFTFLEPVSLLGSKPTIHPGDTMRVRVNANFGDGAGPCGSAAILRASYADGARFIPEGSTASATTPAFQDGENPSNCRNGTTGANCVYAFCDGNGAPQPNPPADGASVEIRTSGVAEFHFSSSVAANAALCVSETAALCGNASGTCNCVSGPAVVLNATGQTATQMPVRWGSAKNFVIEP